MQFAPTYQIYLHYRKKLKFGCSKNQYQTTHSIQKISDPLAGIHPTTNKKISLNPSKSATRLPVGRFQKNPSPIRPLSVQSVQPVFPLNHTIQKISDRLRHPSLQPIKNQPKSSQISDPLVGFRVPFYYIIPKKIRPKPVQSVQPAPACRGRFLYKIISP